MIVKNRLGDIKPSTKITDIQKLMFTDSIVFAKSNKQFVKSSKTQSDIVKVYDSTGEHLLTNFTKWTNDSIQQIDHIRLLTYRYKTKDGITLGSSYGEVKKHYKINQVQSTLKSISLALEDIDILISFDRAVLSPDIRYDMDAEIKPIMIPDDATINRFWINFKEDSISKDF